MRRRRKRRMRRQRNALLRLLRPSKLQFAWSWEVIRWNEWFRKGSTCWQPPLLPDDKFMAHTTNTTHPAPTTLTCAMTLHILRWAKRCNCKCETGEWAPIIWITTREFQIRQGWIIVPCKGWIYSLSFFLFLYFNPLVFLLPSFHHSPT